MKTLYLLRHAKAERKAASGEDFDRPLAERGRRDAALLGQLVATRGMIPEIVLYSPARRTAETVDRLLSGWRGRPPAEEDHTLYLAEPQTIMECLSRLSDGLGSAMIVGHNPGLEDFAGALAGRGAKAARARMDEKFPTAALAVFEIDVTRWRDTTRAAARLVDFFVAKDLAPDRRA